MSHTPGPWWVNGDQPGEPQTNFPSVKAFVDGTRKISICQVGNNNQYRNKGGRDWGNAQLIAAAPDMLEALRICRSNVASIGPAGALEPYAEYREWLKMLDEVIAKATGAQP